MTQQTGKAFAQRITAFGVAFLMMGCGDARFNCGSAEVHELVISESQSRFTAQLFEEYLGNETLAESESDLLSLAQSQAREIQLENPRQIRKNYVEKELLCLAVVRTPRDAALPVSYTVTLDAASNLSISLR
ncbi:hypothetical protein [Aliidiomarina sanyensis]|uniref:Uncharacterized protein n=1 Tax=Aliidiomarina sanyensis TaxID=1249555 RepID=A0A432WSB8_9GAMM|nr:hypothetical protein [Aliidiomarina sanyensis]RUO36648.1 hypothetical protein CWE11_02215 [Aliidiomarina sanyensis]